MSARLRATLLATAGFLVLQLGWLLCIAPHFGIDEFDHAYRASSVAAGHWEPGDQLIPNELGRGDLIPVRADVAEAAKGACESRPYTGTYNCNPMSTLPSGEVMIASGASRYNPAFYAVVGIAAAPFHGTANLFAMRVVAALLGGILFGLTVWLALAGARTVWPLVTMMLAALPTTVYSASIASPNGLEMLAGLGVWVALRAVVSPTGGQRRDQAYALLALFAAVLANTHTLGLVWLGLILVAVAILHGPVTVFRALLPKARFEAVAAGLVTAAVAFEVAWVFASGVNNPTLDRATYDGNPWEYVVQGVLLWPLQAVGAFPMRNDAAPLAAYAIVLGVLIALAVAAVRIVGVRSRPVLGLAFIAVVSFAVPAYLTVRTFHQLGSAWQGRYGMPFTVGLIVVAGAILDGRGRHRPRARTVALGLVAALVVAQAMSQWLVMTKQRKVFELVAATHWTPPSAALVLALTAVALATWTRAVWLQTEPAEQAAPTSDELAEATR